MLSPVIPKKEKSPRPSYKKSRMEMTNKSDIFFTSQKSRK